MRSTENNKQMKKHLSDYFWIHINNLIRVKRSLTFEAVKLKHIFILGWGHRVCFHPAGMITLTSFYFLYNTFEYSVCCNLGDIFNVWICFQICRLRLQRWPSTLFLHTTVTWKNIISLLRYTKNFSLSWNVIEESWTLPCCLSLDRLQFKGMARTVALSEDAAPIQREQSKVPLLLDYNWTHPPGFCSSALGIYWRTICSLKPRSSATSTTVTQLHLSELLDCTVNFRAASFPQCVTNIKERHCHSTVVPFCSFWWRQICKKKKENQKITVEIMGSKWWLFTSETTKNTR